MVEQNRLAISCEQKGGKQTSVLHKNMKKLVLAINHKETEDSIINELNGLFLDAGRPTYREAVLPILKDKAVDVLVLRESIAGSIPALKLVEDIRINSPNTRIVYIANEREKQDEFLSALVSYGIYDIINKNSVYVNEIVSHIKAPRTFRDVSMYFAGTKRQFKDEPQEKPVEQPQKSGGLFSGLFGKPKTQTQSTTSSQFQSMGGFSEPSIDIDTLRSAIQEEERRKAQEGIDDLIAAAVDKATVAAAQKEADYQKEIAELKSDLRRKTNQADQATLDENQTKIALETAQKQLSILQDKILQLKSEHAAQMANLSKTEDPKWFQTQLSERDGQIQLLEQKLQEQEQKLNSATSKIQDQQSIIQRYDSGESASAVLTQELEAAKAQISLLERRLKERPATVPEAENGDITEAPDLDVEYNTSFLEPKNGQTHTIVFLGAKHGVGNSTLALNTAASIAKKGYKVLLMEFNGRFPMINHFFEFTNVTNGIDTACDGILSNNTKAVDKAIIEPHKLKTQRRQLHKAYRKLPAGLHFMVYSNGFLTSGKQTLDLRAMKDVFYYLTMQLQYAYIIVDIQPDDEVASELFLKSGFLADKLVMTMTQDTHSVISAGYMIQKYAAGRSANLIKDAMMILNRYQGGASIKRADIQKWLNLGSRTMLCMTDDPVIYFDSSCFGIPYVCSKAKNVGEYTAILNGLGI